MQQEHHSHYSHESANVMQREMEKMFARQEEASHVKMRRKREKKLKDQQQQEREREGGGGGKEARVALLSQNLQVYSRRC